MKKYRVLILAVAVMILSALFILSAAVYLYYTPHLAVQNMKIAASNRDAKTFCTYIDFPVLRENLKAELNANMLAGMGKNTKADDNFSGLALALGPVMVNNMVDGYVTPASVEQAFKRGYNSDAPQPVAPLLDTDFMGNEKVGVSSGYASMNQFEISYRLKTGTSTLVFERRGIWGWKLVSMKFD